MLVLSKTVLYSFFSLAILLSVSYTAKVNGQLYTVFEGFTTFQLSMVACWLGTIAANTTKSN